jgi:hypothetical protein
MIVYDVQCQNGHVFTGWFRSSDGFEQQAAAGEIACALCGDVRVSRAPMAPNLHSSRKQRRAEPTEPAEAPSVATAAEKPVPLPAAPPAKIPALHAEAAVMQQLRALRHVVETQCDYVGDRFAEEARKIHYGESDSRGIYGETSESESEALAEEGIEVGRIPWVPKTDS